MTDIISISITLDNDKLHILSKIDPALDIEARFKIAAIIVSHIADVSDMSSREFYQQLEEYVEAAATSSKPPVVPS